MKIRLLFVGVGWSGLLALWAGVMSGCGGGVSSSSANYMGPVPTMANSVAGGPRKARVRESGPVAHQVLASPVSPPLSSMFGSWFSGGGGDRESYAPVEDNPFYVAAVEPLSTFSIDVDTASYANVRRLIREGEKVPPGAVRIEEMVNYFDYKYPEPKGEVPFSVNTEVAGCPWTPEHRLLRVGLRGKSMAKKALPPANLVFLLDVSGSMSSENKLPLVKSSMRLLLAELGPRDRIAIVVYAGASGVVLESTPLSQRTKILDALDKLEAGGSTAGAEGIGLAYRIAEQNKRPGTNNRVILATDGDFNVGVTDNSQLERLIKEKARGDVYFTVLGYGMGNYQDDRLELLADKGNVVRDSGKSFAQAGSDFQFGASVAAFGMRLRGSEHKGNTTDRRVRDWARAGLAHDPNGDRAEFLRLVR